MEAFKMKQGNSIFYKIKQIELIPDEYGKHIKIKMISAYTGSGKFVKHIKLDEKTVELIKNGTIIPRIPEFLGEGNYE
tara:strand:- start:370 stop:603 length:234 start_codon:yes stop_codon:yes gene_type:complete